jgi:uncharacterized membrane protein
VSEDRELSGPISLHLSLAARLRAYLFAGILITAPVSITFYIAWLIISFVDDRVTPLLPAGYNPNQYLPFSVPGLGLIVVIWALITIGWLTAGLIGRLWLRSTEAVLHRMPFIRSIYSAVKQIFETILAERATAFREVVLVEFPRHGLWRIAFVTGTTPGNTQDKVPGGLINIFIPATPNVTAGFLVLAPRSELIPVDLTIEEALKLVISGGIATPARDGTQPDRKSRTAASRSNR